MHVPQRQIRVNTKRRRHALQTKVGGCSNFLWFFFKKFCNSAKRQFGVDQYPLHTDCETTVSTITTGIYCRCKQVLFKCIRDISDITLFFSFQLKANNKSSLQHDIHQFRGVNAPQHIDTLCAGDGAHIALTTVCFVVDVHRIRIFTLGCVHIRKCSASHLGLLFYTTLLCNVIRISCVVLISKSHQY